MNTCNDPLISVIMPVFNGEKFLKDAIESILNQTYQNFEFFIINDGSTDNSEKIILSFDDKRIHYIKNDTNLKLVNSLNIGLNLSNGEFIARMDCDDISESDRFQKQVSFLISNPEIGLLGSWIKTFGLYSNEVIKFKEHDHDIFFEFLFNNHFCHPTAMMRASVIRKYNLIYPNFLHAEDYAFWLSLCQYCKVHILPEALLYYRVHEESINALHSKQQIVQTENIRRFFFKKWKVKINTASFIEFEKHIRKDSFSMLKLVGFLNVLYKNEFIRDKIGAKFLHQSFSSKIWGLLNEKYSFSAYVKVKFIRLIPKQIKLRDELSLIKRNIK